MPRLVIVNRAQAPYYKALYTALAGELGDDWEIMLQTLDKHWEGYKGPRFRRDLVMPDGMVVREYASGGLPGLGSLPTRKMWREMRRFRPDVMLVHETACFNLPAFLQTVLTGTPLLVSTEIGLGNRADFGCLVRRVRDLVRPLVAGVVAHSPAAVATDLGVGEGSVAEAWHACDSRSVPPPSASQPGERIRMVFLGQLIPRKGLDLWLEVLRQAVGQGLAVSLEVIGEGEAAAGLAGMVAEMGLTEAVKMHGFLEGEEIARVLRDAEVFVLPSRYDTYGAVTQEAACHGLALLVSKHAGSSVLVEEGVSGHVIDPADRAGCVRVLHGLADPEARRAMMAAGRATGAAHGSERSAVRVAALVRRLGGDKRQE